MTFVILKEENSKKLKPHLTTCMDVSSQGLKAYGKSNEQDQL